MASEQTPRQPLLQQNRLNSNQSHPNAQALVSSVASSTDALIRPVTVWAQYIDQYKCGYCDGESVSAKTTARTASASFHMSLDEPPVILKSDAPTEEAVNNPALSSLNSLRDGSKTESKVRGMPVETYSKMLNRGFRRSGTSFYKIDQRNSCCPQYTMRLDASKYKPSKDHRKALSRFNRWVTGESLTNLRHMSSSIWNNSTADQPIKKKKGKNDEYDMYFQVHRVDADFDHLNSRNKESIRLSDARDLQLIPRDLEFQTVASNFFDVDGIDGHESESNETKKKRKKRYPTLDSTAISTCRPNFRVCMKLAKFTWEKYELFKKYQIAIHKDNPDKFQPQSFADFLCNSPLNQIDSELDPSEIESNEPITKDEEELFDLYGGKEYTTYEDYLQDNPELSLDDIIKLGGGSFHQEYRYNGKLLAFGVLDILPGNCVSSVYLVWDPDYPELELGKVSALREIALTAELKLPYYCLGLYVPSCSKMVYKSSFRPSELLDPMSMPPTLKDGSDEDQQWFPLEEFEKRWDQDGTHTDWYVSIIEERRKGNKAVGTDTELLDADGFTILKGGPTPSSHYTFGFTGPSQYTKLISAYSAILKLFSRHMPGIISCNRLDKVFNTDYDFWNKDGPRLAFLDTERLHKIQDDDEQLAGVENGVMANKLYNASGELLCQYDDRNVYREMTLGEFCPASGEFGIFTVFLQLCAALGLDLASDFTVVLSTR